MKSKFMRMVGRGVEDPEEEDDVFQEYEEEQPINQEILPLVNDGEIDTLYNKFKEFGFQSNYTDKREYVLDIFIQMNNFVSFSFPNSNQTLEGSGLLSDLIVQRDNLETEIEFLKEEKTVKNEEETDEEFELRKMDLDEQIRDREAKLENTLVEIEGAEELDVPQKDDLFNDIYKLKQKIKNLENYSLTNKQELKQKLEKDIKTAEDKLLEKGFSQKSIDIIVPLLSDSISIPMRDKLILNHGTNPENPKIEVEYTDKTTKTTKKYKQFINVNSLIFRDEFKDVTSARILKVIENFKNSQDVTKFSDDLVMALLNDGNIKGDNDAINDEKDNIKRTLLLQSLRFPLLGYLQLNYKGEIIGDEKLIVEAFSQRGQFQGLIHNLIPDLVSYNQDITYTQGYLTQVYASKMFRKDFKKFMWLSYEKLNLIDKESFDLQIDKFFLKNTSSMSLYYSSVFGDVDKIDNIIPIKDANGNLLFNVLMETKSSLETSYKNAKAVYSSDKKIFNLMVEALKQNVKVAFHDFYLLKENYAAPIVNGKTKDIKPKNGYVVDMFKLFTLKGYNVDLITPTEIVPFGQTGNENVENEDNIENSKYKIKLTLKSGEKIKIKNPKYKKKDADKTNEPEFIEEDEIIISYKDKHLLLKFISKLHPGFIVLTDKFKVENLINKSNEIYYMKLEPDIKSLSIEEMEILGKKIREKEGEKSDIYKKYFGNYFNNKDRPPQKLRAKLKEDYDELFNTYLKPKVVDVIFTPQQSINARKLKDKLKNYTFVDEKGKSLTGKNSDVLEYFWYPNGKLKPEKRGELLDYYDLYLDKPWSPTPPNLKMVNDDDDDDDDFKKKFSGKTSEKKPKSTVKEEPKSTQKFQKQSVTKRLNFDV